MLAAFAALTGTAVAQTGDSVTGAGTYAGGPLEIVIAAHSGPSGENPTGVVGVIVTQTNFDSIDVFCLSVTGSRAVIGLEDIFGQRSFLVVEDNATPGAGADTLGFTAAGAPGTCSPPPPVLSVVVVTQGDFEVVDEHAAPTSKDACKDGGRRRYGVFKGQWDCVSFVATRGRNQPANGRL